MIYRRRYLEVPGQITLAEAARRSGFDRRRLRLICKARGVALRAEGQVWLVHWPSVEAAVREELALETVYDAADRHKLPPHRVRIMAAAAGYAGGKRGVILRLAPEVFDQIVRAA